MEHEGEIEGELLDSAQIELSETDGGADAEPDGPRDSSDTEGHVDQEQVLPLPASMGTSPPAMEPSVHSYLGDVEDVARGALLLEGSIVRLPLILLGGVVLFPGETLPLRLYNTDYIRLIRSMLAEAERQEPGSSTSILHLGVLNVKERRLARDPPRRLRDCIGTTAEIRCSAARHAAETSASLMYEGLTLKARGRHRFQVLNDAMAGAETQTGVLFAHVRILPESCPPPLCAILPLRRVFRDLAYASDKFQVTYWSVRRVMRHHCAVQLMARAQAVLTSMASWSGLCGAAGLKIGAPNPAAFGSEPDSLDLRVATLDPSAFSYRLAANLPLDDEARQDLLSLRSPAERLREEVRILEETAYRPLRCANCQQRLALKSEIFSVPGAEGAVGAYVNPEGFVHQTITLREVIDEARTVHLEGEETLTSTWFPGYAWTIAHCRRCGLHLGWRFTRAVRDVTPQVPHFWGIRRTAVMERGQRVDDEVSSDSILDSEDEYEDSQQEEEEGESDEVGMLEDGAPLGTQSDIAEGNEPYWEAMD